LENVLRAQRPFLGSGVRGYLDQPHLKKFLGDDLSEYTGMSLRAHLPPVAQMQLSYLDMAFIEDLS